MRSRDHFQLPLLCLLALMVCPLAAAQVASERQLNDVRERIAKLSAQMTARTQERGSLNRSLADIEKSLAAAQQRRRDVSRQQTAANARLADAQKQYAQEELALAAERQELARQLRAAYTSGRQERIKLVLNQQSPEQLGRMMTYYRYLNDARVGNIDALRDLLGRIAALQGSINEERAQLARLADEADALVAQLTEGRAERKTLLSEIDAQLQRESAMMSELNQRERDLANLLAELSNILADYPVNAEAPLSELKGKLTWPVAGDLVTAYGDRRSANLRSNGVVLATDAGSDVRVIYHGRVAYADWLPGLGLLIIVDHGDDLLSLYGYNETLLKSVGDWVSPGDIIATVGNTGGQARPALYFELRSQGKPLNPGRWFRNKPSRSRR
ncbi:MAG: peptidoglycan DD-metalloendopeptidase family protein [Pseudomonadota bacterium]